MKSMDVSKRAYPRVALASDVFIDFVKWDHRLLTPKRNGLAARSKDVSIMGIGLVDLPPLEKKIVKKLLSGEYKLCLTFALDGVPQPVVTFARMVWAQDFTGEGQSPSHCGCVFIDLDPGHWAALKTYVEERLGL